MRKFLLCVVLIFLSSCSSKNIQHGVVQKDIIIGQQRKDVINLIGQESLQSDLNNCLYYITQNSSTMYFLRPKYINFTIQKICFESERVKNIEKFKHKARFNSKFSRKLKSQDSLTISDFFKEMVSTSNFSG